MSEIKKGDLVMIVRGAPCCGECDGYGFTFAVISVETILNICAFCGTHSDVSVAFGGGSAFDVRMLRRLDSDALKDDMPIKEELHA